MRIIYANNQSEYAFLSELRTRAAETGREVIDTVAKIIDRVRTEGDSAMLEYAKSFDNADSIKKFTKKDFRKAYDRADPAFRTALTQAAKNIKAFHKKQLKRGYTLTQNNCEIGQIVRGLEKVGVYVPGGTAAYPSSVLMNVIPAKLAKVYKIVIITPPLKDGGANTDILASAYIAGADELFTVGGAHGIAALAYGTESIPRVDKIVGPGNIYVATAKKLVYGAVDIDMIAGPSEIMIMADKDANARFIAADMLSQAEHDCLASSILVTDDESIAAEVAAELAEQSAKLPRRQIIDTALRDFGGIIICGSNQKMIELVNLAAPEHLEIMLNNPKEYLPYIKNAGSIFLGDYSPEPLGDYYAGANHVLPTSGTARFYSPLSVDSFIKKIQFVYYTKEELQKAGADIVTIAAREGLAAHAASVKARLQ